MPIASENVHGIRLESIDIFSIRSERQLTRLLVSTVDAGRSNPLNHTHVSIRLVQK